MRVSDQQRFQSFTDDVQQRLVNLTRIQKELGTGKSLLAPSEDVHRAGTTLRTEDLLAADAQFVRNIDDGLVWAQSADSRLQAIMDVLSQICALAVAADNDSQNEDDRRNAAVQMDQKLEELMGLVNASSNGRYLFGGHHTTSSPFVVMRDAEGKIQSVTVHTDTIAGRTYRRISEDEDVQVNISGDRLFRPVGGDGDEDVFSVIAALRNTIPNNNTPPSGFEDTQSNDDLHERLAAIRERIGEQQAYLGSVGQRLEQSKTRLMDREIELTDRLEEAAGVDMMELVSPLAVEEGAYNALAAISTRLLKQTLIDYLR